MRHNTEQLTIGISYSYINYIHEYLTLLNNSLYSSTEYLDTETFSIIEDLKDIFLSLPDIISQNLELKETRAAKIMEFRTILEQKYRVLHAYQRELHHCITSFNTASNPSESSHSSTYKAEDEIASIDFDQLTSDCVNFVFEEPQMNKRQERAALLLPYIPIKITKENYLHYLEKSIQQIAIENTSENAERLVSILEQLFDGHFCPGYGNHFKDLAATLDELSVNTNSEDFYENTELLGETIDSFLKIVHSLYKMIGALANLLLFDDIDFSTITNLHISFYDLYHSVKNIIISDEDRELFLSTLPDKVQEIKDELQISYKKIGDSNDLDPSFALIQTYLSIDVDHIFGFNIRKYTHSADEVTLVFDDFLSRLKERLLKLSNSDRKLRMQYFISTIPFVMSDKTFYAYIKQSFSTLSAPSQSLIAAMYLSHVLEENRLFESTDTEPSNNPEPVHKHKSVNHAHSHHNCNCEDHQH